VHDRLHRRTGDRARHAHRNLESKLGFGKFFE
jgi:hypothetical protein